MSPWSLSIYERGGLQPLAVAHGEAAHAALERDGFSLARQAGSHRHYKQHDGRRVTISFHHSSDTFRPKTLRSMIEAQTRWTQEDLLRLELV